MDWMKYRLLYFLISAVIISFGIFGLIKWGLILSIDFTGGVVAEYKLEDGSIETLKFKELSEDKKIEIRSKYKEKNAIELRFEDVGPSIGPELIKKTVYAIIIAGICLLFWIAVQFKSIKFGISAILAMIHDSFILLSAYSIFGHFWGAEVDFLFVTAVLTVLSFSVHDTIVVYDRIREKQKKEGGNLSDIANNALTETMTRSLNNSFTIIFMLLSLSLIGGEIIRWFSIALLVGTISGTYSSPFVAVPILVTWDKLQKIL